MKKTTERVEKAQELVGSFHSLRECCVDYHGFKQGDEDQCTHPDNNGIGSTWCSFRECPLLIEAVTFHGLE